HPPHSLDMRAGNTSTCAEPPGSYVPFGAKVEVVHLSPPTTLHQQANKRRKGSWSIDLFSSPLPRALFQAGNKKQKKKQQAGAAQKIQVMKACSLLLPSLRL